MKTVKFAMPGDVYNEHSGDQIDSKEKVTKEELVWSGRAGKKVKKQVVVGFKKVGSLNGQPVTEANRPPKGAEYRLKYQEDPKNPASEMVTIFFCNPTECNTESQEGEYALMHDIPDYAYPRIKDLVRRGQLILRD